MVRRVVSSRVRPPWSPGRPSGWIEPRQPGELRLAFFDEATELSVEYGAVLGSDVGCETGLVPILLEDEELPRVVALPVDGELNVAGLASHALRQARDEHLALRL